MREVLNMKYKSREVGNMSRILAGLAAVSMIGASVVFAAVVNEDAIVLNGADLELVKFINNADGSVSLAFDARDPLSPPVYAMGSAQATVGTSSGAFVGNYKHAGVAGLKFSIMSDGHLPHVSVVLRSKYADGRIREWRNANVSVSEVAGEWVVNAIPLERSAGWDRNERPGANKDALWEQGLADVEMVGVEIVQSGIEAQVYTVAQFKLVDVSGLESESAPLSLQEALMERFGVDSVEAVDEVAAAIDGDDDGMTDLTEILTEYDQAFEDSTFAAEIVSIDGNGVTVRWPCRQGRIYTVLRAEKLDVGFGAVAGAIDLVADETGYMTFTDSDVTTAGYFYRIRKSDQ
jgi:hypothetical protein